jgi:hypothetical protein
MESFLLEFSEEQQCWHFNHGESMPNTNTYFTVMRCSSYDQARSFIDKVKVLNDGKITKKSILKFLTINNK